MVAQVKPRVEEINGVLWQVDENGNPVKKLRKKTKPGEEQMDSLKNSGSDVRSSKGRPKVKEINGHLWQVDENGTPIKKVRKKDDKSGLGATIHGTSARKSVIQPTSLSCRSLGDDEENARGKHQSAHKVKLEPLRAVSGPACNGRSSRSKSPSRGRSVSKSPSRAQKSRSKSPNRIRGSARSKSPGHRGEGVVVRELRPGCRNSMGNHGPSTGMGAAGLPRSPGSGSIGGHRPAAPTSPSSSIEEGKTSYIDEKGRRVVIDANGNKIAYDKSGKKLRPKKKSSESQTSDSQLAELQRQLRAAQDEVEKLTKQTKKDEEKIDKATQDMEQLKQLHEQAAEEKRQLDLQLKNFQHRLQEQEEKLAQMPKLNNDGSNVITNSGDHLVKQITGLMDENNILLEKLAKEKTAAAEELRRKESELRFLKMELQKLRAENDMLFRTHGAGSGGDANPMVDKLLHQKEEVETKLTERIEQLQERVETLQKRNETLNEDLNKVTLEIHEDDDEETRKAKQMAQAVVENGTKDYNKAKKATTFINNGISSKEAQSSATNALRMIYRANKTPQQQEKKTWFS